MSGVFRELQLTYNGVDYHMTPSNKLLRRIEAELAPSSLTDMITRVSAAKPPVSEVAYVAAEFLRAAGADDVDEDKMYAALMADVMNDGGAVFAHMCEAIVAAISPAEDIAKKSAPRAPSKAGKKKKPKSTGR